MYQWRCMNSVAERSCSTRLFTCPREKQRCSRMDAGQRGHNNNDTPKTRRNTPQDGKEGKGEKGGGRTP